MKTTPIAVIFGILISLALFWLMQTMISHNQQSFKKTENLQMTEFVRLKREIKQNEKERAIPEEPPPPKKRPPPPPQMQMQQTQVTHIKTPQLNMPVLDIPLQTDRFKGSVIQGVQMTTASGVGKGSIVSKGIGVSISTNVIPLVRIPPRYPMRAANRRIEGWVKIEFTITTEGTVKDAVVIDAKPKKTFNRAALKAIKRWKFKAKIVGGKAIEQRAVQVLQFKLSK